MSKTLRAPALWAVALALTVFAMPMDAAAQGAPLQAGPEQEAMQIQMRLMQTQQQALQDPELQAAQETVTEELLAAMEQADPTLAEKSERAEAMQAEIHAAQQAEDQARLQELAGEAQQLEMAFATAQQQAMQDPELQASMGAFQDRMVAKMTEIDPETPQLIARLEQIQAGN